MSRERGSYNLQQDGAPVLIIEVASEATVVSDLDLEHGKGWSYAHAGVRRYLVLDPTRQFIPEEGRGWRLREGVYVPWERDAAGRWQSQESASAMGWRTGWRWCMARASAANCERERSTLPWRHSVAPRCMRDFVKGVPRGVWKPNVTCCTGWCGSASARRHLWSSKSI